MSDEDEKDEKNVYHYTSEKGMKGITRSGQINPSVNRDGNVAFGEGKTYMTGMNPEKNKSYAVAMNNYDRTPEYAKSRMPDTKYAIGYDPKDINAKREATSRSVYTAEGSIPLEKAKTIHKVGSDGKYKKIKPKQNESKEK